jgi:hypothetical protein
MDRFGLVVPYRDRKAHLREFVPAVQAHLARTACRVHAVIVEQEDGLPFNRGALKNIGFLLTRGQGAYTCFHDIDYLPLDADYSTVDAPTPILWYGAEARRIAPGSDRVVRHDMNHCFGGVVLVPNADFARIDGYANDYWGWGYEDVDLTRRLASAGIACGRRKGTFQPLDHPHEGYEDDGSRSRIGEGNRAFFAERWAAGHPPVADGLSTLIWEVLRRHLLPGRSNGDVWEMVTVRLGFERGAALEAAA